MNNGAAVTITFNASAGIDATTFTGGTHNGVAIVGAVTTANTITYNAPVAVNQNVAFNIVLNGITHGTSIAAGNISVTIAAFSGNNTGTTNNYTTGASGTPTTAAAGADQAVCGTTATMAGNVLLAEVKREPGHGFLEQGVEPSLLPIVKQLP